MRTRYLQILCLSLTFILTIMSCNGCGMKAYACELIDSGSLEYTLADVPEKFQTVSLGNATYELKPSNTVKSVLNNEVYEVYTINEISKYANQNIKINSRTREIIGFNGIQAFPQINGMELLSDDEIKLKVEEMLDDLVDFSIFNTFKVGRPVSSAGQYHLLWQVQKGILCNIKVEVYITSDGWIHNYAKIDACPDDLSTAFVSNDKRNQLIEKKICENLGIASMNGVEYEILSETLSLYNNENAIIYIVKVIEDGFSQVFSMVIS